MGQSTITTDRPSADIESVLGDRLALMAERDKLSYDAAQAHYLFTEMVHPLIGATIFGGVVIGDGSTDEPFMPVLFVEQNGKTFSLIISSDDECNDGGRILIERGYVAMGNTTAHDAAIAAAIAARGATSPNEIKGS